MLKPAVLKLPVFALATLVAPVAAFAQFTDPGSVIRPTDETVVVMKLPREEQGRLNRAMQDGSAEAATDAPPKDQNPETATATPTASSGAVLQPLPARSETTRKSSPSQPAQETRAAPVAKEPPPVARQTMLPATPETSPPAADAVVAEPAGDFPSTNNLPAIEPATEQMPADAATGGLATIGMAIGGLLALLLAVGLVVMWRRKSLPWGEEEVPVLERPVVPPKSSVRTPAQASPNVPGSSNYVTSARKAPPRATSLFDLRPKSARA